MTDEIHKLIDGWLDGELSAEQTRRLEAWLREDEQHVAEFVRATSLHRQLRDMLLGQQAQAAVLGDLAPAEDKREQVPVPPARPRSSILGFLGDVSEAVNWRVHPVRFFTVAVLLTVVTWVGFYFWIRPALLGESEVARRPGETTLPLVARLRRTADAQWAGSPASAPIPGSFLQQGRTLELKSGLAEIRFDSGASVILEGPVEFILLGENEGDLQLGKLAALVPEKARGFAVKTPHARVEDQGTEFGVDVDSNGAADVVVLAGRVDLTQEARGGRGATRIRLVAGQGAFVDADSGKITRRDKVDLSALVALRRQLRSDNVAPSSGVPLLLVNGGFDDDGNLSGEVSSITGWQLTNFNAGWQTDSPPPVAPPTSGPNVAMLNSNKKSRGFPGTELTSDPLTGSILPGTEYTVSFDAAIRDQGQFGGGQNIINNLGPYRLIVELAGSVDGVLASIDVVPRFRTVSNWHPGSLVWDSTGATAVQDVRVILRAESTGNTDMQFVVDSVRLTAKQAVIPEPASDRRKQ